ncbi:hypothetical protein IWW54_002552 [Coemansia sp. RSA 2705]|nr:hypothetical protein IWW54_002552 [Coemansia sp. RSA 2705]
MIAYYIEILDNLQVVDIYAARGGSTSAADIRLVNETEAEVGHGIRIKLPVAIVLHKAASITLPQAGDEESDWIRIRAPIAQRSQQQRLNTVSRSIAEIGSPVTAAAIHGLTGVCCKACGANLLSDDLRTLDSIVNVRDLPSAHWSELVDCWMCHPEEDKLNVNPELMFSFEPDKQPLVEPRCSDTVDSSSGALSDKVHIWMGNTHALVAPACLQAVRLRRVELAAKVSNSSSDGRPPTSMMLSASPAFGDGEQGPPEFLKCIKINFVGPKSPGFATQAKQWLDSDSVELISLLDDDCDSLLKLLNANALRIPPQIRTMANMTRSFLPLDTSPN